MSSRKSLIKIRLDEEDVFLMSQYESESNLHLQILNVKRNEAYTGQVSDSDLRLQAASIRLTYSDFLQKATNALFERNPDCLKFRYSLNKIGEDFVFKWKSIDEEETIISLGNVKMKKRDAVFMFTEVLQSVVEEMHMLQSKVTKMSTELKQSQDNSSEIGKQLVLAIDAKESIEKELYSKFVLVLNEKKRRIKELQTSHSGSKTNQPKYKKTKTTHPLSSESSDVDDDFDINRPGPSSATSGRNSLLFLEDNKTLIPAAKNTIRNRKVPVSKKSDVTAKVVENTWSAGPIANEEEDSDDLLKCL